MGCEGPLTRITSAYPKTAHPHRHRLPLRRRWVGGGGGDEGKRGTLEFEPRLRTQNLAPPQRRDSEGKTVVASQKIPSSPRSVLPCRSLRGTGRGRGTGQEPALGKQPAAQEKAALVTPPGHQFYSLFGGKEDREQHVCTSLCYGSGKKHFLAARHEPRDAPYSWFAAPEQAIEGRAQMGLSLKHSCCI
ncbi:uncharacterized protein WM294_008112 [Sarcoramphus papa]